MMLLLALVLFQTVPGVGPNKADEPLAKEYSFERGRAFMEEASTHWQTSRKCLTCHTNGAYLATGTGYGADRPAYAAADIFVFASTKEGFGNVLIEAMAAGLPVVARRLPGVTDSFIDHGRTGFLFDTAAEYTALVQALVDDPGLRRRVGDAARAEVAGGHSLQAVAQRYVMLYRNLYKGAAK